MLIDKISSGKISPQSTLTRIQKKTPNSLSRVFGFLFLSHKFFFSASPPMPPLVCKIQFSGWWGTKSAFITRGSILYS